jgi:glutamyl-tRNA synthetase
MAGSKPSLSSNRLTSRIPKVLVLPSLEWSKTAIAGVFKEVSTAHQLKMPQLATAVRILVYGRAQTPSIDAVLASFERGLVLGRLGLWV